MPIPAPEPGLVVSYAYLWHREHEAGREEGRKDRPSAIVLAVEREADDATIVTVLPITHGPPADQNSAVEIPLLEAVAVERLMISRAVRERSAPHGMSVIP